MSSQLPRYLAAALTDLVEKYRSVENQMGGNALDMDGLAIPLTEEQTRVLTHGANEYDCSLRVFFAAWIELVGTHDELKDLLSTG